MGKALNIISVRLSSVALVRKESPIAPDVALLMPSGPLTLTTLDTVVG